MLKSAKTAKFSAVVLRNVGAVFGSLCFQSSFVDTGGVLASIFIIVCAGGIVIRDSVTLLSKEQPSPSLKRLHSESSWSSGSVNNVDSVQSSNKSPKPSQEARSSASSEKLEPRRFNIPLELATLFTTEHTPFSGTWRLYRCFLKHKLLFGSGKYAQIYIRGSSDMFDLFYTRFFTLESCGLQWSVIICCLQRKGGIAVDL